MSDRIAQMDVGIGFDIQDYKLKELLDDMDKLRKKAQSINSVFSKISMPNLTRQTSTLQSDTTKALNFSKAIETTTNKTTALDKALKESNTKIDNFVKGMQQGKDKTSDFNKVLEQGSNKAADFDKKLGKAKDQTADFDKNLTKTKDKMGDLDRTISHSKTDKFDQIKNKLKRIKGEAEKTGHTFRDVFAGSMLGNAVSNALSNISSQFHTIYDDGMAYNGLLGKIDARFKNMGLSDSFIKKLDEQKETLIYHTNMDDEQAANVQAKMLNWSSIGDKGAMDITKTIAGIGDGSKLDGQSVENLASGLMRVGASGKVSYSALSRVTKSAPAFYEVLSKGAGMSKGKMIDLLKTGDVTQKQFQTWMANASKYSKEAFDAYDKTQGGAQKQMEERWKKLKGIMTKPLFDAKSTGLHALNDILKSPELEKGAQAIGNGISSFITTIDKHKADISTTVRGVMDIAETLGKNVWQDFSGIFINIGKTFGFISKDSAKSGSAFHAITEVVDNLAKNKTALKIASDAIVAILTVKATKQVASPLLDASKNVLSFAKGLKGIEDTKDLDEAATKFLKRGNKFRDIGKSLGEKFSSGFHSAIEASGKLTLKAKTGIISSITGSSDSKWSDAGKGLFDSEIGKGKLGGMLQSMKSAGGFSKLTTAGKIASGAAIGGSVLAGGAQIYSAITKDKKGSTKKYSDIGSGIGTAIGGGIATAFLGPEFAPVGAAIGKKLGEVGGQAVHSFKSGWNAKKPPKNFWSIENLGWSTHDTVKKVSAGAKSAMGSFKKGWDAKKPPKNIFSLQYLGWSTKHGGWSAIISDASARAAKSVQTGWNANKPPKNFWSLENLGWSAHSMWNGLKSSVTDVIKWFKDKWTGLVTWFDNIKSNLSNFGHSIDLTDSHSNVRKIFSGKKVGSHALGSRGGASHYALVGEAGTEIGYHVNGSYARLLGANGPEIVKIQAGENILPAGPSAKILNGGLGKGMTLPGYANGKGSPKAITADTVTTPNYTKAKNATDKYQKDALAKNRKFNNSLVSDSKKLADKRVKNNKQQFDSLERDTNKSFRKLNKQWSSSWDDITDDFKHILNRLPDYTQDALNGVVGQLNKGFKGINSALGQFGGNDHVLSMIHYANGTDRPVERPHLAVLNDSPRALRQETIVHANGSYEFPQGNNVVRLLHKGDSVLNGEDTFKAQQQGILPFYASGKNSHSALQKLAENNAKNYQAGFNRDFTANVKVQPPRLQQGVTILGKNAAKPTGYKWYQAMYNFINSLIHDGAGGTREAFLNYAKEHFSGKKYVMGATGPDAYDCSGMVSAALSHFGIDIGRTTVAMQESSGVQSLGHDFSRTVPGDLVIYGHGGGAAGHVGIINSKANNSMFNETPPSARVTSIDTPKSMGYEYFRVKGLHNASAKTAIPARLTRLVKSQLGTKAINWIKSNLSEDALGGSVNLTGDIGQRARALAKALMGLDHNATKNGIAAILGNWFFESRLDSGAVNSDGGASGLGQWLGGRLSNLRAFAKSHGKSWTNPAAQLKFALSGEGSDSSIFKSVLEGHGSVADLANKFSSKWERGGYNAEHVNGARQVAGALRGLRNGGHVKAGERVRVNEDGIESFRPDVSGTVIPHAQTIKNINNNAKKAGNITINQNITVHATGNNASETKAQVKDAVDQANVALIEKLQELMGFNDDGGVII